MSTTQCQDNTDEASRWPVYRVLLTGGPCGKQLICSRDRMMCAAHGIDATTKTPVAGGKSAALQQLKNRFESAGLNA